MATASLKADIKLIFFFFFFSKHLFRGVGNGCCANVKRIALLECVVHTRVSAC